MMGVSDESIHTTVDDGQLTIKLATVLLYTNRYT